VGRHSYVGRDERHTMPGASWGAVSAQRPWTVRRKLVIALGSVVAVVLVTTTVSAALGERETSGGPPLHDVVYSTSAGSGRTEVLAAASPVAVGSVAIARVPSPHPSHSSPRPSISPSPRLTTSRPTVAPPTEAPNPLANLEPLPVETLLEGSQATAWADAALEALGAPTTGANVQTMLDWFGNEGIPHDYNNPLNLNTPYGGSTISTANGSSPEVHIQAYPTPADFTKAFAIQIGDNPSYPAITAALKSGIGLEGSAATPEIASELEVYSGGGYDSIPGIPGT
jgi:hypothetical protein